MIALLLSCAFNAACQRTTENAVATAQSVSVSELNLEYDAGVVDRPSIRHAFVLANPLEEPIVLGAVKKGCNCTECKLSAPTIPPGGFIDANVEVDLGSQFGSTAIEVAIDGRTASGRSFPISLRLACDHRAALEVFPPALDFGSMSRSRLSEKVLHAWDTSFRNIEVVSVTCSLPGWQCEVAAAPPETAGNRRGMKGWLISVRPPAEPAIATHQGTLLIKTSSKSHPDVSVPITASVTEDVFASPGSLFWSVTDDVPKAALVRIRAIDEVVKVQSTVVKTDVPWLHASIGDDQASEDDARTVGKVTVKLEHQLLQGTINRGQIRIEYPDGPAVSVPVTVVSHRSNRS